jgi:DNA-directed RNA polymerase specialized sigma24 family protein
MPDLVAEIAALDDADLLRLRALARLRARGLPGLDGMDLLNEAMLRLLDGSRSRPLDVPLVAVLATAMRGVAHDHWRKVRRERPVLVPLADDAAARQPDLSPTVDPERVTAAVQALAEIDRLFADDAVALRIIAGLAEGLAPEEIRRRYAIGGTAYDSARRRMRRALLRQDGDGERP